MTKPTTGTTATATWVDEKGRTRRRPKPEAATSAPKPKTKATPKAKARTAAAPTPAKETTMAPAKKGRRSGIVFNPPTIAGTADSAPRRGRPSIYQPIVEQIVAANTENPEKWVLVNPEGRKAASFRSAIASAAKRMDPPITLETSEGEVDGTVMVYVRVKGD